MKLQYVDSNAPEGAPRTLEVRRNDGVLQVEIDGRIHRIDGGFCSSNILQIRIDGRPLRAITASSSDLRLVARGADRFALQRVDASSGRKRARHDSHDSGGLTSTMPGQVLKVMVKEGDPVRKGQGLVVIEAMKMEHEIKAPRDGRVKRIACSVGNMVSPGLILVELEAEQSPAT